MFLNQDNIKIYGTIKYTNIDWAFSINTSTFEENIDMKNQNEKKNMYVLGGNLYKTQRVVPVVCLYIIIYV